MRSLVTQQTQESTNSASEEYLETTEKGFIIFVILIAVFTFLLYSCLQYLGADAI